jgi:malonate transporter
VLGVIAVLAGLSIPKDIASGLQMIGSATSGVAVFAVALILAAHTFQLSRVAVFSTIGRITVQTLVLFGLLRLLHVEGPFALAHALELPSPINSSECRKPPQTNIK